MSRKLDMQRFIRHFREVTGKTEIDMKEVANMAGEMGWILPEPLSPLDRLAQEFSRAAREETLTDGKTGRPYRVNHAITGGNGQATFWVEIDTAPRKHMLKSSMQRREQTVGDMYQITLDLEHWNRVHPTDAPITAETDLTFDVELRKHASEDDEQTG